MTIALVTWATASGTNTFTTSAVNTTGATLLVAAVSHYNGQPAGYAAQPGEVRKPV